MKLSEIQSENNFAKMMLEKMNYRQSDLFQNMAFCSAVYVDPRFNFSGSTYLSQANKNLAKVFFTINNLKLNF